MMRIPTIRRILRDVIEDHEAELVRDYYSTIGHVLNEMSFAIHRYIDVPTIMTPDTEEV